MDRFAVEEISTTQKVRQIFAPGACCLVIPPGSIRGSFGSWIGGARRPGDAGDGDELGNRRRLGDPAEEVASGSEPEMVREEDQDVGVLIDPLRLRRAATVSRLGLDAQQDRRRAKLRIP